jgi:acetyl-CoA decarbonylase/synthase, CODH/ACS complex subunit gamma
MALTGLEIQKLLPKTNCKECGSNTCLAFAMKLAAKKAELSACPYASEEAKQVLGAASEPPVKSIELGPDRSLKLGAETCLYRHEKTFVNQTVYAVNVNDTDSPETARAALEAVRDYSLDRVGEVLRIEMVAVTQKQNSGAEFAARALRAWETAQRPLILRSPDAKALVQAALALKGTRCVLAGVDAHNVDELKAAAAECGHVLSLTAPDLNQLVALSTKLRSEGFNDVILEYQTHSLAEQFQVNSLARRAALRDNFKPLGYPSLRFLESDNLFSNAVGAVTEVCKYGGICVLPCFDPALFCALMTIRQNIYTDPQKPIQVEPKVYPIGEPKPNSPVFVTTNFSLTYFLVSGEIENSGTSGWLVVPECEGMSVLTAWAAGKFSGTSIAKFMKAVGVEEQVTSRELIIPGYVAQISGELEENLPGWKVLVGPQEAGDIESFMQSR